MRVLLAMAIAITMGMHEARAQCDNRVCPPRIDNFRTPPIPGPQPPSHRNDGVWYATAGILAAFIGLVIKL
jgi:hypothetical protein